METGTAARVLTVTRDLGIAITKVVFRYRCVSDVDNHDERYVGSGCRIFNRVAIRQNSLRGGFYFATDLCIFHHFYKKGTGWSHAS